MFKLNFLRLVFLRFLYGSVLILFSGILSFLCFGCFGSRCFFLNCDILNNIYFYSDLVWRLQLMIIKG